MYASGDWRDGGGDNSSSAELFVTIAILDFSCGFHVSRYLIVTAFIVVTKVGSKVAIIFALIINIVDLLLSVLGWHFGGKKRNVLFCIIWVGFLALNSYSPLLTRSLLTLPGTTSSVSQRHQHEEQVLPQQESVAVSWQPLPSHGKNNTYQETPFTEFGEDDLHSLASHQKYYPY
ncbi:hypothetical protein Ocin01_15133 [Orchesella cincta]|uniref:Uncharacterized protein n=1 Tax=Orchesella cincta TaxID=48709 RepID=A0A1D2MEV8_ORCCI|nr:hypothetical protein Ocin01_15133 [Orchesella cincta]